jgi:hypothetical protein
MIANHHAANKMLTLLVKMGGAGTPAEIIALAQVYATLAVADQLERKGSEAA